MDQRRKGRKDHPRVCGEKTSAGSPQAFLIGSPPRMRGKGVKHRDGRVRVGITPAYAGKSRTLGTGGSGRRDHPRVCGEKGFCIRCTARMVGSPPRMRGKVYLLCLLPIRTGITPAYAGKSLAQCFVRFSLRDHPRVCGEKFCKWLQEPNTMGSPPRMRGKD